MYEERSWLVSPRTSLSQKTTTAGPHNSPTVLETHLNLFMCVFSCQVARIHLGMKSLKILPTWTGVADASTRSSTRVETVPGTQ